jgi:hypothetical protein
MIAVVERKRKDCVMGVIYYSKLSTPKHNAICWKLRRGPLDPPYGSVFFYGLRAEFEPYVGQFIKSIKDITGDYV